MMLLALTYSNVFFLNQSAR